MKGWELLLLAVGLSMDAFAASVCKGLSVKTLRPRHALTAGGYFGAAQALMPLIGYLLGIQFQSVIQKVDHWIAFLLLGLIGGNMIRESRREEECGNDRFDLKTMLPLAIATSIDALAVGVTFAFLKVEILPAVGMIGLTTFLISAAGVWIGHAFGSRYQARAELLGGIVLVLIGLKILIEHLVSGA